MKALNKFLIVSLFLFLASEMKAQGMEFFHGTWEQTKAKAKQENKFIFFDAYTTWCGPCKWMKATIFPMEDVGKFYNANFINVKFDMESGEGLELAKAYHVVAYPTFLFFNPSGELVHVRVGGMEGEDFIACGREALDPTTQLMTLKARYEKGDREPALLSALAKALSKAGEDGTAVANEYLNSLNDSEMLNRETWDFIYGNVYDISSPHFAFVVAHKEDYVKVAGEGDVEDYLNYVPAMSMQTIRQREGMEGLETYKSLLKEFAPEMAGKLGAHADYFFRREDMKDAFPYAKTYFGKWCDNWNELNSIAWDYFENTEDKAMLEAAAGWAKKSIEMNENYYNTDTYANLLVKLEKWKEAKTWAEKALDYAKAEGEETAPTEALIEEIISHL